ncbi:TniQ family protein [Nocardia amamiensis]|uniref:TniQ family protein n=1 Tax=Nocardia amamiensis TaxID=404578 RepID=UPI0034DCF283
MSTRYCPDCLAGNGSTVHQTHGGGWRRSWRLPIVFACLEHRQLLQHLCPDCGRPAHGTIRDGRRLPLLPGPRIHGLHPAQCRWTPTDTRLSAVADCGARLDTTQARTPLSAYALVLQQRLIDALSTDGAGTILSVGEPTRPTEYFTGLRILSSLVHKN